MTDSANKLLSALIGVGLGFPLIGGTFYLVGTRTQASEAAQVPVATPPVVQTADRKPLTIKVSSNNPPKQAPRSYSAITWSKWSHSDSKGNSVEIEYPKSLLTVSTANGEGIIFSTPDKRVSLTIEFIYGGRPGQELFDLWEKDKLELPKQGKILSQDLILDDETGLYEVFTRRSSATLVYRRATLLSLQNVVRVDFACPEGERKSLEKVAQRCMSFKLISSPISADENTSETNTVTSSDLLSPDDPVFTKDGNDWLNLSRSEKEQILVTLTRANFAARSSTDGVEQALGRIEHYTDSLTDYYRTNPDYRYVPIAYGFKVMLDKEFGKP